MPENPNDTRSDIQVETDSAALPAAEELQQALDQSLRFAPLYRSGELAWQGCAAQLLASSNDHQIKLADSAREEWRVRGWPGYLRCLPRPGAPA